MNKLHEKLITLGVVAILAIVTVAGTTTQVFAQVLLSGHGIP
ncbi:MAG: hypothetical protein WBZ36_09520 [Candidatus Nitrosopolaris sp.]